MKNQHKIEDLMDVWQSLIDQEHEQWQDPLTPEEHEAESQRICQEAEENVARIFSEKNKTYW